MIESTTRDSSVYSCDLCKERMIVPHDKSIKDASWLAIKRDGGWVSHLCPICREDFREADQSQVNGYSDPAPVIEAARACMNGLEGAWRQLMNAIARYDAE
jgi:hypothetical protein